MVTAVGLVSTSIVLLLFDFAGIIPDGDCGRDRELSAFGDSLTERAVDFGCTWVVSGVMLIATGARAAGSVVEELSALSCVTGLGFELWEASAEAVTGG